MMAGVIETWDAQKKRHGPGSGPLSQRLLHENCGSFSGQPPLVPSAASAVALHLTAGQAHDGRQFEALYESLAAENVLKAARLDRGYDADRIRARLAYDGIEAVIPALPTRCGRLPFDAQHDRERNRIERFFNKLKQFRRVATRYDKLAKTFCAAVHLVAAFLIARNS